MTPPPPRRQINIPIRDKPAPFTGVTAADLGQPPPTLAVAYTHVGAYEGTLWRCDVCMAAVVQFPDDHPFIDHEGLDVFERHARWHRQILGLESF